MKTIGIIGGLGPLSTIEYYRRIEDIVFARYGKYPHIVIDSVDMEELLGYMSVQNYDGLVDMLLSSVKRLQAAGADFAAISSNTPHMIFDRLRSIAPIPMVSIVESTVNYARSYGFQRVLLTGTAFTMRNTFYQDTFSRMGLECIVPESADIDAIHSIIFPDLENGKITPDMLERYTAICNRYISLYDIQAVILGCTELPILVQEGDLPVPVIDTVQAHVEELVRTANVIK